MSSATNYRTIHFIFNEIYNKRKGTFVDSKFTFQVSIAEHFVIHSGSPSTPS